MGRMHTRVELYKEARKRGVVDPSKIRMKIIPGIVQWLFEQGLPAGWGK